MKYLILFLIVLPFTGCIDRQCVETDIVIAVGGCSEYGDCAVMTINHGRKIVSYPAPGQEICVEYK